VKRAVLLIVFAVFVLGTLISAPVEIEFWHSMGGGQGEAVNEIVNMFNSQNPNIVVKPVYIGNYNALNQKLLASVQSDTLPVLSQAYANWTSKLLQSDVVEPLNDYIFNDEVGFSDEEWADIYDVFKEMGRWGDTYYSLPFNKSIYVMFYNSDLFELEGLEPPKTLEEYKDIARLLTVVNEDGEVERYGTTLRPNVDTLAIYMYNNGVYIVEENEDGEYEVTINSEKTKEVLEYLKGFAEENIALVTGDYEDGPFGEGRIAFYISTIAGKSYVDRSCKGKHEWNWTAIPRGTNFEPPLAGTDVIMFESATDEQKDAAWKFMKYLIDPKVTTYWAMKTGYLPVRKSALETAEWKTYTKLEPKAAVPVQFLDDAYSDPKPATWNEIRYAVGDMFANIMYDKWTIEEGLEWVEKEIAQYLAEEQ
jgi:multiple sugar transport system substrate-binding protein